MKFTVASFNVNSIRSRKELLLEWLLTNCPDVICLQETKVRDIDFPEDFFKEKGFLPYIKDKNPIMVCQTYAHIQ